MALSYKLILKTEWKQIAKLQQSYQIRIKWGTVIPNHIILGLTGILDHASNTAVCDRSEFIYPLLLIHSQWNVLTYTTHSLELREVRGWSHKVGQISSVYSRFGTN